MRRTVITCLAVVLAVIVGIRVVSWATQGDAQTPPLQVGLVANTLGWGPGVGHAQSLVTRAGVHSIREELHWSLVEPRRGQRNWAAIDRMMAGAARRRLTVLPLLNDPPAWASDGERTLPVATRPFAQYVADVVRRYGDGGTFWRAHPELPGSLAPRWFELWNEPYYAEPVGSQLTASRYAALAMAGMRAGRAVSDHAHFLVSLDTSYDSDPPAPLRWITQLQQAQPELLKSADGFAVHPYSPTPEVAIEKLERLDAMLRAEDAEHPIWVTEIGWSTCPVRGVGCVSEARQALSLSDFLLRVRTLPRSMVPAVFLFSMHDIPGPPPPYEDHFGLLRLNSTGKPAWRVVQRFTGQG